MLAATEALPTTMVSVNDISKERDILAATEALLTTEVKRPRHQEIVWYMVCELHDAFRVHLPSHRIFSLPPVRGYQSDKIGYAV